MSEPAFSPGVNRYTEKQLTYFRQHNCGYTVERLNPSIVWILTIPVIAVDRDKHSVYTMQVHNNTGYQFGTFSKEAPVFSNDPLEVVALALLVRSHMGDLPITIVDSNGSKVVDDSMAVMARLKYAV